MSDEQDDQPPQPIPVLPYASPAAQPAMTTIFRSSELAEAEMVAGELEAEGIRCVVSNTLTAAIGAWGGGARVYVDVPGEDVERAKEVLRVRTLGDEVEPAEEEIADDGDEDAAPLVIAAAYDTASKMRDAVTLLGASRVRSFTPRLVARGDRPKGEGDRFVVCVRQDDLDRAREVLHESSANPHEEGEAEPRCPKCSSWRVHRTGSIFVNVGRFFGLIGGSAETDPFVCLACGHRWLPSDMHDT